MLLSRLRAVLKRERNIKVLTFAAWKPWRSNSWRCFSELSGFCVENKMTGSVRWPLSVQLSSNRIFIDIHGVKTRHGGYKWGRKTTSLWRERVNIWQHGGSVVQALHVLHVLASPQDSTRTFKLLHTQLDSFYPSKSAKMLQVWHEGDLGVVWGRCWNA